MTRPRMKRYQTARRDLLVIWPWPPKDWSVCTDAENVKLVVGALVFIALVYGGLFFIGIANAEPAERLPFRTHTFRAEGYADSLIAARVEPGSDTTAWVRVQGPRCIVGLAPARWFYPPMWGYRTIIAKVQVRGQFDARSIPVADQVVTDAGIVIAFEADTRLAWATGQPIRFIFSGSYSGVMDAHVAFTGDCATGGR